MRSPTSLRSTESGAYKDRIREIYMKDDKHNILTKLNDSQNGMKDLLWQYNGLSPESMEEIRLDTERSAVDKNHQANDKNLIEIEENAE